MSVRPCTSRRDAWTADVRAVLDAQARLVQQRTVIEDAARRGLQRSAERIESTGKCALAAAHADNVQDLKEQLRVMQQAADDLAKRVTTLERGSIAGA